MPPGAAAGQRPGGWRPIDALLSERERASAKAPDRATGQVSVSTLVELGKDRAAA
jgi:DNA helicase-2/ATP-dependent DNA helicase PcrA